MKFNSALSSESIGALAQRLQIPPALILRAAAALGQEIESQTFTTSGIVHFTSRGCELIERALGTRARGVRLEQRTGRGPRR